MTRAADGGRRARGSSRAQFGVTDPVHNERIKLTSALFNTMAGSSFTVGVAAPFAAAVFYQPPGLHPLKVLLGGINSTLVAALLHRLAQAILRRLRA